MAAVKSIKNQDELTNSLFFKHNARESDTSIFTNTGGL